MPEGSSSDAPVIKPGPRALPRRFRGFFSARNSAALGSTGRPGSTLGPTVRVDAFRSGKGRFSYTLCKSPRTAYAGLSAAAARTKTGAIPGRVLENGHA